MRTRAGLSSGLLACALACNDAAAPRDQAPPAPAPAERDGDVAIASRPATVCEAAHGAALQSLTWVPDDARLVVRVDLEDPALEPALATLAAHVAGDNDLPVVSTLALSQLGLQLSILRPLLAAAKLAPRELALLQTEAGEAVWVLHAPCDIEALRRAMEEAWPVRTRGFAGGVVAEPARPGGFFADVVFASDDRIAFVPVHSGTRLARWLEGSETSPGSLIADDATPRLGELVDALEAAPIRVVIRNTGFLSGDRAVPGQTLRRLRVLANTVEEAPALP